MEQINVSVIRIAVEVADLLHRQTCHRSHICRPGVRAWNDLIDLRIAHEAIAENRKRIVFLVAVSATDATGEVRADDGGHDGNDREHTDHFDEAEAGDPLRPATGLESL